MIGFNGCGIFNILDCFFDILEFEILVCPVAQDIPCLRWKNRQRLGVSLNGFLTVFLFIVDTRNAIKCPGLSSR